MFLNTFLLYRKYHYNIPFNYLPTLSYFHLLYPTVSGICYNDQASLNCGIIRGHKVFWERMEIMPFSHNFLNITSTEYKIFNSTILLYKSVCKFNLK